MAVVALLFFSLLIALTDSEGLGSIVDDRSTDGELKVDALLSWTDVRVKYKSRNILHLCPGEIRPGKLLGILGPSG
jgi:ABC-type lipopolysaccharide export system ATPase subunit